MYEKEWDRVNKCSDCVYFSGGKICECGKLIGDADNCDDFDEYLGDYFDDEEEE